MKLRALQDTAVNTPHNGPRYVRGPTKDELGELVEVADDFVVNPHVFRIEEPPASGAPRIYHP